MSNHLLILVFLVTASCVGNKLKEYFYHPNFLNKFLKIEFKTILSKSKNQLIRESNY